MVEYRTEFWDQSTTNYTTETQITYPNLKPGTKYTFKIRVVAGNLTSDDVNTTAKTGKETSGFCYCVSYSNML